MDWQMIGLVLLAVFLGFMSIPINRLLFPKY